MPRNSILIYMSIQSSCLLTVQSSSILDTPEPNQKRHIQPAYSTISINATKPDLFIMFLKTINSEVSIVSQERFAGWWPILTTSAWEWEASLRRLGFLDRTKEGWISRQSSHELQFKATSFLHGQESPPSLNNLGTVQCFQQIYFFFFLLFRVALKLKVSNNWT